MEKCFNFGKRMMSRLITRVLVLLQASMRERGKFEEETFVNVSGRTRNTSDQVPGQLPVDVHSLSSAGRSRMQQVAR
jgi:hypothetical protein